MSGPRQPTLSSELHAAQEILVAAAIAYHYEGDENIMRTLPTVIEAVLAWTVREGVTNVIRHSHAHQCTIRVTQERHTACVEVLDDGIAAPLVTASQSPGATSTGGSSSVGNGLRGRGLTCTSTRWTSRCLAVMALQPRLALHAQLPACAYDFCNQARQEAQDERSDVLCPCRGRARAANLYHAPLPCFLSAKIVRTSQLPACRVLILTTFGRPGYLRQAMESGVVGFLLKDAPSAQLATAIRRAIAGRRVAGPVLAMAARSSGNNPLDQARAHGRSCRHAS